MSGYIQHEREPPPSREQWIAIGLSIMAGAAMLFIALYASKVASGWIGAIGRIPPAAPLMFVLGSTMLMQPPRESEERPAARWVLRNRRLIAGCYYLIGIAMIALPIVLHRR